MEYTITKANGLGNNFVFADPLEAEGDGRAVLAKQICDVKFGLGADGLVLIEASQNSDFKMSIFNADGSEAEMCGNAVRCAALYVRYKKLTQKKELLFETLAGKIATRLMPSDSPFKAEVDVNMGRPQFSSPDLVYEGDSLAVPIEGYDYSFVSMGNPHAVAFTPNYDFDYRSAGKRVENRLDLFPNKTNVEFVRVLSENEIEMRVWERGCGETWACGTGACAAAAAAIRKGYVKRGPITVRLRGGNLRIDWRESGEIFMLGRAAIVMDGVFHSE